MRRIQLLALILIVFGTAGFTMPGCSKEQKQMVVELIEQQAYNQLANELDRRLTKIESKLNEQQFETDFKAHYQSHVGIFRELIGEVRSTRTRDEFVELAGNFIGAVRNLYCDIGRNEGEVRVKLESVFGDFDKLFEPFEKLIPGEEQEEGRAAKAANRRNFKSCP